MALFHTFGLCLASWTSQDPMGFAGNDGNLYRYVRNDTTNGVDPSGLTIAPYSPVGPGNVEAYEAAMQQERENTAKPKPLPVANKPDAKPPPAKPKPDQKPHAYLLEQSTWGHGLGHVGLVVGSPATGYTLYSYGAHNQLTTADNLTKKQFETLEEALKWARMDGYDGAKRFDISLEGVDRLKQYVESEGKKRYKFLRHNCLSIASGGLIAGGVEVFPPKPLEKPSNYFVSAPGTVVTLPSK